MEKNVTGSTGTAQAGSLAKGYWGDSMEKSVNNVIGSICDASAVKSGTVFGGNSVLQYSKSVSEQARTLLYLVR